MANQYRSVLASSGPAPTGGDALPAEVLSGKTFTNDNGAQTGTMTNNGAVSQTLAAGASYTIPEGYHNGNGVVTAGYPSQIEVVVTHSSDNSIKALGGVTHDLASHYSNIKYEVINGTPDEIKYGSTTLVGSTGQTISTALTNGTNLTTEGASFTVADDLVFGFRGTRSDVIKVILYN